jgi:hypothetical protein
MDVVLTSTLRTDDDGNEVVIFRFSPAEPTRAVAS